MFNYYNLLTHIFIDCILFKLKLYLFLDFLKYVCILLGIDGQNDKVIWKLSNYLRYFPKKNYFFQKFWGGLGHQVAPPLNLDELNLSYPNPTWWLGLVLHVLGHIIIIIFEVCIGLGLG